MITHLMLAAQLAALTPQATRPEHATQPAGAVQPAHAALAVQAADTATTSYEVAGLRVIHRPLAANDIVAVNLYLLGGARQIERDNAGIEPLVLRASEFGTARYPGRESRLAFARTGSRTTLYTEPDWTVFGFRGIRSEFDATWDVFADRVVAPTFDSAGVEVVRNRMVRSARSVRSYPDGLARVLADSIVYEGHPYQNDPEGTETSLRAITIDDMRDYHASQMVTSRMLVVVVGNITRSQVEAAIHRTFAQLPKGDYVWSLPPVWTPPRAAVTFREQRLPTNYIIGYFAGPPSDNRDYLPFRVATQLLGGFSSSSIRDAGLSYAAYSPFLEQGASGGGVYVTTTRPDTAIRTFNHTIDFLQNGTVPRLSLQRYYDGFITSYFSQNESNGGQADFLARYELLHGDWRKSADYMSDLKDVQGTHIRRAARTYMRNIQYVFIGNPRQVPSNDIMTKY